MSLHAKTCRARKGQGDPDPIKARGLPEGTARAIADHRGQGRHTAC